MSKSFACHMLGDYVLQSDWMAVNKTSAHVPAALHGLTYTLPFVALTRSPARLAVIAGTHMVIDRYRLARYPIWLKNQTGSAAERYPLSHADGTGYHDDHPATSRGEFMSAEAAAGASTPVRGGPEHRRELHRALTGCTATVKPIWMRTWLFIMADNALHLVINELALGWRR